MLRHHLIAAALLLCGTAGAATNTFDVARYMDLQTAEKPQISPDGSQIVYTRKSVDRQKDEIESALWLIDADGQHHRFLAKGSGAVWSPDGKSIAYLAEGQPQGTQIFVAHLSVPGPATQLTSAQQAPANLHWSPDGQRIGFTMEVPAPEEWSIDLPAKPKDAHWANTPFYTERLHYRRDHFGLTGKASRQLFLVSLDGSAPRQVTHGDWRIGETVLEYVDAVDWGFMPDGHTAIVEGFREGNEDRNDRDCYVYAVNLDTGSMQRLITTPGGWREPAVSPDGKTIAYVGFSRSGDLYRVSDLWTMAADGSRATLRSQGFDREPQELTWAPDSKTLYFTAEDRGSIHLYTWSARGGIKQLTHGAEVIKGISASAHGVVMGRSDFSSPQNLYVMKTGTPSPLTHLNEELFKDLPLAQEQELWFESGSTRVQGWLVKPPGFDPQHHYPLLLEIHGGPNAMYTVAFNPSLQNFAANGYLVLYVNPRGSTGYGSAFGNAIAKHYPGPDYDDLMAGVDTVIKQGVVDTSHLFVAGCSGGGVLSSWTIGHTDRFAAAAVRCPVTDWLSMAGQTDIPYFTYRFFQKPFWDDPSDWLAQSSLMHVGAIKTPTLIMTGELDRRTPIQQTEELYAALKYRGVPSALLRFDGEYHGTGSKPSNWMRTQLYMMSWFHKYGGP